MDNNLDKLWGHVYGGPQDDQAYSIVQTTINPGYAIAGWTKSYGPDPKPNVFILKLNPNGTLAWANTYSLSPAGFSVQEGYAITEILGQSTIRYAVVGRFIDSLAPENSWDAFVLLLDQYGNPVSNIYLVGRSADAVYYDDEAYAVIQDESDIVVAGWTASTSWDANSYADIFVSKLSLPDLTKIWAKSYGWWSGAEEKLLDDQSLIQLSSSFDNDYAVCGSTWTANTNDPQNMSGWHTGPSYLMIRLNRNTGDDVWTRFHPRDPAEGSPNNAHDAYAMIQHTNGQLAIAGEGRKGWDATDFHLLSMHARGRCACVQWRVPRESTFSWSTICWENSVASPDTGQFSLKDTSVQSDSICLKPWQPQRDTFVSPVGTVGLALKDGGAMVAVDHNLYAFRGNKTNDFIKYDFGLNTCTARDSFHWKKIESIPYGYKYPLTNPPKINKKHPGKGASLCYDGDNTIYATKGNGTKEFWAYTLSDSTWRAKAYVAVPKALKGGTSIAYYNGKVYLLAGGQKKTDPHNFYVYDPDSDYVGGTHAWAASESLPLGPDTKVWKDGSCLTLLSDTIYALKGGDKFNYLYAFDGTTWVEQQAVPLNHPLMGTKKTKVKDGGAITSEPNRNVIFAIKGGGSQEFWAYSPSSGLWIPLDTIPKFNKKSVPKTGAALACVEGYIYLLKGNKTSEFWQWSSGELAIVGGKSSSLPIQSNSKFAIFDLRLDARPNPFTKVTTIRYTVPIAGKVIIKLYNTTGRLIKTISNKYLKAGNYAITLSTKNYAKGAYFLRYIFNSNQKEIKLIVQ